MNVVEISSILYLYNEIVAYGTLVPRLNEVSFGAKKLNPMIYGWKIVGV